MNKKLQKRILQMALFLMLAITTDSWGQIAPDANGVLYVKKGAAGNGSSWTNALGELGDALKAARDLTAGTVSQIWVAGGTYHPQYRPDNFSGANPLDRNNSFMLVKDVKLYGGFAGIETQLSQRDLTLTANASILSGDYNNNDIISGTGSTLAITNNDENAYHVVMSLGANASNPITNSTVLDGFTIRGGNANMVGTIVPVGTTQYVGNSIAGGMYNYFSSPIISNIIIIGNVGNQRGGGMFNVSSSPIVTNFTINKNISLQGAGVQNDEAQSRPYFSNGVFNGNVARGGDAEGGGAMNNFGSSPTLINIEISENHTTKLGGGILNNTTTTIMTNVVIKNNSSLNKGGGIYSNYSDEIITNCIVTDNTAAEGGGMYVERFTGTKSPFLTNVTFARNSASVNGGAIYNTAMALKIRNCIIYDNLTGVYYSPSQAFAAPQYRHSLVQDATTNDANGNIDGATNPLFVDAANGNYKIQQGSPVVDAGSSSYYASGSTPNLSAIITDIIGNDRFYDGTPDMGAYELNCAVPNAPTALPQSFCASATVADLDATVITGAVAKWYASADVSAVALGDTASLTSQTYYVSQALGSCESAKIPVVVTVTQLPAAPTAINQTFCGATTVASLVPAPSETILWYATADATEALAETATLTTRSYFVSQKTGTCEGPKTEISVLINTPDPVVTPQTYCEGATVAQLQATTITGSLVQWYAGGTFGEVLGSTYQLTTGSYYVSQTVDGCESRRVQVAVTITEQAIPDFAAIEAICKNATAPVLGLTSPNGIAGTWSPSTINTVQTGTSDYVFTPSEGTCAAIQTLSVTIKELVAAPTGEETQDFVEGATLADFQVTGQNILWYDAPTGGNLLAPTHVIVSGGIYYASQTLDCGESSDRLKVVAGAVLGTPVFGNENFSYYPNPVKDIMTVSHTETIDSVAVFNILGQQVFTKTANEKIVTLPFSTMPSGTYIVKVVAGQTSKAFKAIKE
ncbi:Ig-like domain-containing protein [Flavobacterium microcysteis]